MSNSSSHSLDPNSPEASRSEAVNVVSPETALALLSIVHRIGLAEPKAGEDLEDIVARMHHRIDYLIRAHARQIGARKIIELMAMHDDIARLVP
ncbi:MAG: hypothetical protein AB7G08_33560 [Hyphomicrobiaceae bacterium]